MEQLIEIKPCIGINNLEFGCSKTQAESLFGKPQEIQLLDEFEDSKSTVYHYWEMGFSLFFDEQNEQKLSCIEVDCTNCELWGVKIFSCNEKQLIELLRNKGYKILEQEKLDFGEKRIGCEQINIDFYFENNKMISINFGKQLKTTNILILPN